MTNEATLETRDPAYGVTVSNPVDGMIYLLPSASGIEGHPAYMGADMLLMKRAVAEGIAIEYSVSEDEREFVEHFSAGVATITLTVAIINLVPSIIQGIHALIQLAAMRKGFQPDQVERAEVQLKIDYLKTATTEARGIEINGNAAAVVALMTELSTDS
jgi:hypothetical protein